MPATSTTSDPSAVARFRVGARHAVPSARHRRTHAGTTCRAKGEGGTGFVDVWKRGHFAWEYKCKGRYKDLEDAYRQLYQYRDDLDNPPLSVVCDIKTPGCCADVALQVLRIARQPRRSIR